MLQTLNQLCYPSLDKFQWNHVFLLLENPNMYLAPQMCSLISVEKKVNLSLLATLVLLQPKRAVCLFCSENSLMAHDQLVYQDCKDAFHLLSLQHMKTHRVVSSQMQNFSFIELLAQSFLQPVEVPLNGSTTLWYICHSFRFVLPANLLKVHPVIQVTNEKVKNNWSIINTWGTPIVDETGVK